MGKKYIIELEDKPFCKGGDFLYRVKGFKSLVFDMTGIGKLTPYTEPDLDKVKADAYNDGYKVGREAEKIRQPDLKQIRKETYQRGLSDAWNAARKIWEYDTTTLREIFGEGIMRMDWFMKFTASEAIEKIWQYEQEQQIHVGDEVDAAFGKAVVTGVGPVHFEYDYADGSHGYDEVKNVKKTGRHFPEIAEVLQKMREGQEQ